MASIMAHPWAKHSKWVIDQSESALNLLLYIKKVREPQFSLDHTGSSERNPSSLNGTQTYPVIF